MKYMGSKRAMLSTHLGKLLRDEVQGINRFADLFVGSAAVAWHVAENAPVPVIAADLQEFAVVLANAVIYRTRAIDGTRLWRDWAKRARRYFYRMESRREAEELELTNWLRRPKTTVVFAQKLCRVTRPYPVTRSYGGYYFSPKQALQIDALRATLPSGEKSNSLALAALICAASECAAAPGHTAQPFKPTKSGSKFLFEAWKRDVFHHTQAALKRICLRRARTLGNAMTMDAVTLATELNNRDVAFLDPPYSGVHYSRFYHVLETIVRGECSKVSGEGRYPLPNERPTSDFSIQSKSKTALDKLLSQLAGRGVRTILTFPQEETSNGLSGEIVEAVAAQYFSISKTVVNGRFSTLGGNLTNRQARIPAYEIILVMRPR